MTSPTIEERLSAAAFTILTDDRRHSEQAQRWASGYLRFASHGHATEFQARIAFPAKPRQMLRGGDWQGRA